jgi:uncharacterized protein (TIGR03086 family)
MLCCVDVQEVYARCSAEFSARVHTVDGRWAAPSPLPGWDVRTLVNHLVYEERWTPLLFGGATIAEVGTRFDGDRLGDDPVGTIDEAAAAALDTISSEGALDRTVHLSFGDYPSREYAMQLSADHLVHAVDLARALGTDETVDGEVAAAVREWFGSMEEQYRAMGVTGPKVVVPPGSGPQAELLGMMGRRP